MKIIYFCRKINATSSLEGADTVIKRKLYAKFGVKEYWIVDPEEKNVEVMELEEKGFRTVDTFKLADVLSSKILPSLNLKISQVFS